MPVSLRSQHISELKSHITRRGAIVSFDNKVLAIKALLSIRNLGIPTRRWANKVMIELRADLSQVADDPIEFARRESLLVMLAEKNDLAIAKHKTRIENKRAAKEAEKLAGYGIKKPRKNAATPAPVPPDPAKDPFLSW